MATYEVKCHEDQKRHGVWIQSIVKTTVDRDDGNVVLVDVKHIGECYSYSFAMALTQALNQDHDTLKHIWDLEKTAEDNRPARKPKFGEWVFDTLGL